MSDTTTDKQETEATTEAEAAETAEEQPNADVGASETPTDDAASGNDESAAGDAEASGDGAAEGEEAPPPEPTPEELLAKSKAETKAMKEKMLRVAADFENYRRRSNKEMDDARKRGTQTAIKDLLPVFDNLERATAHVDDTTDAKSMADGLRMVHKQFIDVLGKMGIARVEALGQGFDPSVHESIQYEHSDEYEAGLVMNVLQPGYKQGDLLIRPALVQVSRGPAPAAEPEAESADAESADAAEAAEGDAKAGGEAEADAEGSETTADGDEGAAEPPPEEGGSDAAKSADGADSEA